MQWGTLDDDDKVKVIDFVYRCSEDPSGYDLTLRAGIDTLTTTLKFALAEDTCFAFKRHDVGLSFESVGGHEWWFGYDDCDGSGDVWTVRGSSSPNGYRFHSVEHDNLDDAVADLVAEVARATALYGLEEVGPTG